ncbi:hypothetical protein GY45DRAFT_1224723, partial [Cubamyces sp. BRFM 1775]
DDVSQDDLQRLRQFAFMVDTQIPDSAFAKLPFVYPDAHIDSWKAIQSRVAQLSGITPELYDCCVNSCVCFTGPHAHLTACPHCNETRHRADGRPRARFMYIPLTPRLKALQGNKSSAQQMRYRADGHHHIPGTISDVMDASHYRTLLDQRVVVNDHELSHKFFDDPRDVALGVSTDGFAPHRRRKKT